MLLALLPVAVADDPSIDAYAAACQEPILDSTAPEAPPTNAVYRLSFYVWPRTDLPADQVLAGLFRHAPELVRMVDTHDNEVRLSFAETAEGYGRSWLAFTPTRPLRPRQTYRILARCGPQRPEKELLRFHTGAGRDDQPPPWSGKLDVWLDTTSATQPSRTIRVRLAGTGAHEKSLEVVAWRFPIDPGLPPSTLAPDWSAPLYAREAQYSSIGGVEPTDPPALYYLRIRDDAGNLSTNYARVVVNPGADSAVVVPSTPPLQSDPQAAGGLPRDWERGAWSDLTALVSPWSHAWPTNPMLDVRIGNGHTGVGSIDTPGRYLRLVAPDGAVVPVRLHIDGGTFLSMAPTVDLRGNATYQVQVRGDLNGPWRTFHRLQTGPGPDHRPPIWPGFRQVHVETTIPGNPFVELVMTLADIPHERGALQLDVWFEPYAPDWPGKPPDRNPDAVAIVPSRCHDPCDIRIPSFSPRGGKAELLVFALRDAAGNHSDVATLEYHPVNGYIAFGSDNAWYRE